MPKFECKQDFNHKGKKYREGDIIELSGKYADIYMQNNWIGSPKVKKKNTETATKTPEGEKRSQNYPKHTGGGWFELSNGEKVQGKEEAEKRQAQLEGG